MDAPVRPALTDVERRQLLVEWNETRADYPEVCVHDLFEAQVGRTPDEIALIDGTEVLTYRELDQRANQLAHHLQQLGVEPDHLVGICAERSASMVVGLLGILKAGGAYVPLDPAYPAQRIAYMITDATLSVLITDEQAAIALPEQANTLAVVYADRDQEAVALAPRTRPVSAVRPDHLAYVIYTSGSTGAPKGGAMHHEALVNLLYWHAQRRPASCGLKTLQFCTISFDFSFHEIFSVLCLGGSLVLVADEVRRDPFALARFIREQKIEKMFMPVAALHQLAEAVDAETAPTDLREVITTGEALRITPAMVAFFERTGATLHNHYGATEFQDALTYTLAGDPKAWPALPPIGRPLSNVQAFILDEHREPVPIGETGELYIGGAGLAQGYLHRPELTRERFIDNPFGSGRLYKTGDLARYRADGTIENLGRADFQVKIRGVRVEMGEIEAVLARHPAVRTCVVASHRTAGHARLVAYVVARPDRETVFEGALHAALADQLPAYMLPDAYIWLDALPLTPSGKVDRMALPAPKTFPRMSASPFAPPRSEMERLLASVWKNVLHLDAVGIYDNFFDIGATSLLLVQVCNRLSEHFSTPFTPLTLLTYPTVESLARHLNRSQEAPVQVAAKQQQEEPGGAIAVIGMAGRFPGALNTDAFWSNLQAGVESISFFTDEEIEQRDRRLLEDPAYVRAGAVLNDVAEFDAAFFGISPKEAAIMDPQHRLLLECAWEAFEQAGYDPEQYAGSVGVYGGSSYSTYLINQINPNLGYSAQRPLIEADMVQLQVKLGNDRSYLPTRVSYKLNLDGPSVNVQTACSTALVAVHLACQALRLGECDMALAGGVSIIVPHKGGYLYEEGMIRSPDGHCRAFDAAAAGTLFGNGGGMVLLKRLDEALAEGDHILAVVKGSAVNNDGALKAGFTAPSVERQAAVIQEALRTAGVDARTISYVEAHGTGTRLGDPIELAALTRAFQASSDTVLPRQYCAVGSVKTNIGHLDEAAGIAGFIKTVLALDRGSIPPSLHFNQPNPQIDFENSPFYVNSQHIEWNAEAGWPRRAGISSFGMGGTNCHVVLEEAPQRAAAEPEQEGHPLHVFTVSARSETALKTLAHRYVDYLDAEAAQRAEIADICFTAGTGRKHFEHRLAVPVVSTQALREHLEDFLYEREEGVVTARHLTTSPRVAFLFTGQGGQYAQMGRVLYQTEPTFRQVLDRCDALVRPHLPQSLLSVVMQPASEAAPLDDTCYTQPALFALAYALVELWKSWGIEPEVVMGHSVGEYVAACVAGVFSPEEALRLLAERGRLMQALPSEGHMISVAASEAQVAPLIAPFKGQVAVAAVNGPRHVVLSGSQEAIQVLRTTLEAEGTDVRSLNVSHAFHSPLMTPMLEAFSSAAQQVTYASPRIKLISTVTGTMTADEVATPEYWMRQVREPVQFAKGMAQLERLGIDAIVEVGPKPVLLAMGRRCLPDWQGLWLPCLRPGREWLQLLQSVSALYLAGAPVDWRAFYAGRGRRRLPLPTYPWQRERHWIETSSTARMPERRDGGHPLLGQPLPLAQSEGVRFQSRVSKESLPWLTDHRVFQTMVMPGVAYLEMALAAGKTVLEAEALRLSDFVIQQAMDWPEDDLTQTLQVILEPQEASSYTFRIYSMVEQKDDVAPLQPSWTLHATGRLSADAEPEPVGGSDSLAVLQAEFDLEVPVEMIYQGERERAIDLGPRFHVTERLWQDSTRCLSEIKLLDTMMPEAKAYQIHPVLLEACFLALTITYPEQYGRRTYVPFGVERLRFRGKDRRENRLWCHAVLRPSAEDDPEMLTADVDLFASDGQVVLVMEGVLLKRAQRSTMMRRLEGPWGRWLYEVAWRPRPPERATPEALRGQWLVLAEEERGRALAGALQKEGAQVVMTFPGTAHSCEQIDERTFRMDMGQPAAFTRLMDELPELRGVVHGWWDSAGATARPDEAAMHRCASLLFLVQALAACGQAPRLFLVSQGTQAVDDGAVQDVAGAACWGLAKVVALEHPELACVRVDLDPDASVLEQTHSLAKEIRAAESGSPEDQVAYRAQSRYVARLIRSHRREEHPASLPLRKDGCYLITGAMGGLGLQVAGLLAQEGAKQLVLVGRGRPSASARQAVAKVAEAGAQVVLLEADIAAPAQIARILREIEAHESLPPLRGVLHLAGVLDDGVFVQQTPERMARVMDPKVAAWHLHTHTVSCPLDFFVLFSSVSSLLGAPGQSTYAAANAFLDGLASYRRGQGLPGLSINWGSWAEVGMSARLGLDAQLMARGEGVITPPAGLRALTGLMRVSPAKGQIAVLPTDWPRFAEHWTAASPFLDEVISRAGLRSSAATGEEATFLQQIRRTPDSKRKALLEALVRKQIARVLGRKEHLDPERGFFSLGMDSLTSLELRNNLQDTLACTLPPTLPFDYPTISSLVSYLLQEVVGTDASMPASPEEPTNQERTHPEANEKQRVAPDEMARKLAEKLGLEGTAHG